MRKKDAIGAKLAKLAEKLIDSALDDGNKDTMDPLDVFKAVGQWHTGVVKAKARTQEDDEDAATFTNFRERIAAANQGD